MSLESTANTSRDTFKPKSHPLTIKSSYVMLQSEIKSAGGKHLLLTDTHHFSRFYSAIVMLDGIESDNAKLTSK